MYHTLAGHSKVQYTVMQQVASAHLESTLQQLRCPSMSQFNGVALLLSLLLPCRAAHSTTRVLCAAMSWSLTAPHCQQQVTPQSPALLLHWAVLDHQHWLACR
jgi:hypothetical protein